MFKLKLDIMKDEAYNPRVGEENIGKLCLWHRRRDLGDDKGGLSPRSYLARMVPARQVFDPSGLTIEELEGEVKKNYLLLPVYGYEHGGLSISISPYGDKWDSGRLGFIYCEKDKSVPSDDEARLDRLKIEVERYNYYLRDIAFCATTEIYFGDKLISETRSGTMLGFPEMYALSDIMPLKHIHAFEEDFDKNKTSWLPPMTKWAKLKDRKAIAKRELKEAAKDTEEINAPLLPLLTLPQLLAAYFKSRGVRTIHIADIGRFKQIVSNLSVVELNDLGYSGRSRSLDAVITQDFIAKNIPELYCSNERGALHLKDNFSIADFCCVYPATRMLVNFLGGLSCDL